MTKEEIIRMAMQAFGWKEAKCLSWYKLENKFLGGNSPFELVTRGESDRVIAFLKSKRSEQEPETSQGISKKMSVKPTKKLRFRDQD